MATDWNNSHSKSLPAGYKIANVISVWDYSYLQKLGKGYLRIVRTQKWKPPNYQFRMIILIQFADTVSDRGLVLYWVEKQTVRTLRNIWILLKETMKW